MFGFGKAKDTDEDMLDRMVKKYCCKCPTVKALRSQIVQLQVELAATIEGRRKLCNAVMNQTDERGAKE